MFREFREFAIRGNVLDMAVGIVIGVAFGRIVSSFVDDVLMPPIGLLLGNADFSEIYIDLGGGGHPSLAAAQEAGAPTLNIGLFANAVVDFVIVAFAVFLVVRTMNRLKRRQEAAPEAPVPAMKECPYCLTSIPVRAVRCAHCTSELDTA